jgi:hypothetical protein
LDQGALDRVLVQIEVPDDAARDPGQRIAKGANNRLALFLVDLPTSELLLEFPSPTQGL